MILIDLVDWFERMVIKQVLFNLDNWVKIGENFDLVFF